MPEIPEIETVRYLLEQKVRGKIIREAVVGREKSLNVTSEHFITAITGQQVTQVSRRAKQIIISLANQHSLIIHFMLEGYVRMFYPGEPIDEKPSVALGLRSGETLAFFRLNLGYIHLVPTVNFADMSELTGLGPEPLSRQFTLDVFLERLSQRKAMIKPLLMKQEFIAGIGNVYSNETLFYSRIRPERNAVTLTGQEQINLYRSIRDILTRAIELGGVYEKKFSSDDRLTGGFEPCLKVAYRTGQPCFICGTLIETRRVGGRNAFYCPVCQH